jgi:X-X-X-Leu-X-X-Gly heptad repeat protein
MMRRSALLLTCLAVAMGLSAVMPAGAVSLAVGSQQLTSGTKTYAAPQTCTVTSIADSYVNDSLLTGGTNFGTTTTLLVHSFTVTPMRAYLRFDLGGCSPAIPADAIVRSAVVRLTLNAAQTMTRTYLLRRVTSVWSELVITGDNEPLFDATATASVTIASGTAAGTAVEWPVTDAAQSFVTGALSAMGWQLDDSASQTVLGTQLTLRSREGASGRPQLLVTYVR